MNQEIIRMDLGGVNCYLGKQGESYVLFDTGGHLTMDKVFDNRREKLQQQLESNGCIPGNLNLIVLTHGDNDHAANAKYVSEIYHAKIAMHTGDVPLVERPTIDTMMESFHYSSPILNLIFKIMKKKILKVNEKVLSEYERFTPDILLRDGDNLSEYGLKAKIIYIPGHTKGSIGILTDNGDLIAGDTFANMKKPSSALNAIDFTILHKSIGKLKTMDIKIVYQGHGESFEMKQYTEK